MPQTPAPSNEPKPAGRSGDAPSSPVVIAGHSALEFLLTCVMLFGVTTICRWVIGPSFISQHVHQIHLQLLFVGAVVGVLIAALILSRPGRTSGGHMNPAISFTMWRLGVFPKASVVPYIVAQLMGSALGVFLASAVWGPPATRPPAAYALLQPGPGWTAAELFAGEAASMAVIVYLVGFFLRIPRLAPLVPCLVGVLIGAAIPLLGTTTGGSINPARQFGPAVASGQLSFLWVYLLAPMAGALLAALALDRVNKHRTVLTHRLCGTKKDGAPLKEPPENAG